MQTHKNINFSEDNSVHKGTEESIHNTPRGALTNIVLVELGY